MSGRVAFLLTLNLFLLVVGSLLEIYAATVLVMPLILPIAAQFNVNPIHLGVIFLTNLAIGYIMPPVGLNLFISAIRFAKPSAASERVRGGAAHRAGHHHLRALVEPGLRAALSTHRREYAGTSIVLVRVIVRVIAPTWSAQ